MKKTKTFLPNAVYAVQRLAREEMKKQLLADIAVDMQICKIEGWDIFEYMMELEKLLKDLLNKYDR